MQEAAVESQIDEQFGPTAHNDLLSLGVNNRVWEDFNSDVF